MNIKPTFLTTLVFLVPVTISFVFGIYWYFAIVALTLIFSLIYHSRGKRQTVSNIFQKLDKIFAILLIFSNLYIFSSTNFNLLYFYAAAFFAISGLLIKINQNKKNYEVNHSIWNVASGIICTISLASVIL